MPAFILPDSKIVLENIALSSQSIFQLKAIEEHRLTTADKNYFYQVIIEELIIYPMDFSTCSEKLIDELYQRMLQDNTLGGTVSDVISKLKNFLALSHKSRIESILLSHFNSDAVTNETLIKLFAEKGKDSFCANLEESLGKFSILLLGKNGLINRLLEILNKKGKEDQDLGRNRNDIALIIYISLVLLHLKSRVDLKITEKLLQQFESLLEQIFFIKDEDDRCNMLSLFSRATTQHTAQMLKLFNTIGSSKRLLPALICISTFCTIEETEYNKLALHLKEHANLYREGLYNRVLNRSLQKLALDPHLDVSLKFYIMMDCFGKLTGIKNKTQHYATWSLLTSLLTSGSSQRLIDCAETKRIKEHDNIVFRVFRQLLSEKWHVTSEKEYSRYRECFPSEDHHLFLVLYLNSACNPNFKQKDVFDKFIHKILDTKQLGFRALRYNQEKSPHLKSVFKGSTGRFIKSIWSSSVPPTKVLSGTFKGCQVFNSDDYWPLATWGTHINCLTPEDPSPKMIALILNGEHRLLYIKDADSRIIAGAIIHLALRDLNRPTVVVMLGKTYYDKSFASPKLIAELQQLLDAKAIEIAQKMQLSLFTFLFSGCYARDLPETKPLGIFLKPSTYEENTGLDLDMYNEHRKDIGDTIVVKEHYCLHHAAKKQLEASARAWEYKEHRDEIVYQFNKKALWKEKLMRPWTSEIEAQQRAQILFGI